MSHLRHSLEDVTVPVVDMDTILRRGHKLRWRRRALVAAATISVMGVLAGAVVALEGTFDGNRGRVAAPEATGAWKPIGPAAFQPVPTGTPKALVLVAADLSWHGPVEGAPPTECVVAVIGEHGDTVGARTKLVEPPKNELPHGASEGFHLSVMIRVPRHDMGTGATIECAPSAQQRISVYLAYDVTSGERDRVRDVARSLQGAISVRYVSKRGAFQEFKDYYADQPEYWRELPLDALPARFDITLSEGTDISDARRTLLQLEGVDDVFIDRTDHPPRVEAHPTTETFARFQTVYPETRRNPQEDHGILEIDAEAGTICSDAYFPWARAAQVHERVPLTPVDPVYITIFEPPTAWRSEICIDANRDDLQHIIDEPHRFYVDYHERDKGGKVARSEPLAPRPQEEGGELQ